MKAVKLPKFSFRGAPKLRMPKHASAVKSFFLSRLFREKVLLLGFVLLIAVTWLSAVLGRTNRFNRLFTITSEELKDQRKWLTDQPRIDLAAKAAVEHLDPAKTYDSLRLQSEIVSVLQRSGITAGYSTDNPVSERASVFTKHSIQVTIRNVDWDVLRKFYFEVVKLTPYIGFEQVTVTVGTNQKHSAVVRIDSIELAK